MKRSHGKFLIAAVIPVMATAVPGITYATCTSGSPDGPATWDSSIRVPRTATLGGGTDIGPDTRIGGYVSAGQCDSIGMDDPDSADTYVRISSRSKIGNGVIVTKVSSIGYKASVGDDTTIDASTIASYAAVSGGTGGFTTNISGSYIGGHSDVGANATITGSSIASYVRMGDNATVTGSRIGYNVDLGNGVTVNDGSQIGRRAAVDSGVTIGSGAYIGSYAHICADVAPNMTIASKDSYGCN